MAYAADSGGKMMSEKSKFPITTFPLWGKQDKAMLQAEVSIVIRAPQALVAQLYRDYHNWSQLFPATIRNVRLVRAEGARTELEIERREGRQVPNVMTEISANRIDLWEAKRHYDADFVNLFEEIPEGTRYTVLAYIRLKGVARLLSPFLNGYIRWQIMRYVLEPMKVAAQRNQAPCTIEE
jgi:hypothetical protein